MPLLHGEDAYERKLRPVYDALDARSYKQAVKLADAALKKYKGDQLVRALKGYALHRTGKAEEALQLMRDIVAEGPEAERVVMTMAYTYKAAGQPEGITQAYVAAVERLPRDPDLQAGLFRSYVREFNFVKQQQVAMKLSKLAPPGSKEAANCAWWMVCSLALQARAAILGQDQRGNPLALNSSSSGSGGAAAPAAGGGLAPEKLLQLAETMAARQAAAAAPAAGKAAGAASPAAGALLSYEALLLHLDILQGQGKASAALEALDGPLGSAVPLAADRLQLRAAALVRAGDLPAAAACYQQALAAAPDDWLSWQLYLDCMLPGSGDGSGGPGCCGSTGGSRFPVGVVGGLADIWDQRQQRQAAAAGPPDVAALTAVEASMRQLDDEVAGNDSWRQQAAAASLRAPHLWPCEVLLRRQRLSAAAADAGVEAAEQERLAAAVGAAFARLAGNFSCVSDLRPYLAVLSGQPAEQLAAQAHAAAAEANAAEEAAGGSASSSSGAAAPAADTTTNGNGETGSSAATNGSSGSNGGSGASGEVRRLQRLVNAFQLEAELGLPLFASPAEAEAHAARLLQLYQQHMHLSAKLDEKERGYGEELVALAVGTLMRAAALEGSAGQAGPERQQRRIARMLQALLILEAAQQRRKVSALLRLAATALYTLLGAPSLAAAQLSALDIKSILHDSMTGHWLLPLLAAVLPSLSSSSSTGSGGNAGSSAEEKKTDLRWWVRACAALHELHQQEAGETLATALEHGTYSKVPEFVDFKERLQHSHARALSAVMQALLPPRPSAGSPAAPAATQLSLFPAGTASGQRAALQHARQLLLGAAAGGAAPVGEVGAAAGSGSRLRFNEDLSTRPSWYPPGSASSTAVADWWQQAEQQAEQQGQGYARCWWAGPLAAEGPQPEAAAWRQRCLGELRTRVAWALAASAALDSASDAAELLEQLQPLVGAAQAGTSEAAAGSTALQAAACRAALALLQALAASQAAQDLQAVQELGAVCVAAGERAAADVAAVQGLPVLPGGAIVTAAALAADCAAIAAVCGRLKKLAGKRHAEAAAAAGDAAAAAAAAAAQVKQAAADMHSSLDQQQRAEGAAQLVQECSSSSSSSAEQLWGFEPELEVQPVLAALVDAQAAVLRSLQ